MLQSILHVLNGLYRVTFDDIKLHRDMIGFVCFVYANKEKYVLKLFRNKHTMQALQSIEIMTYLSNSMYPTANIIVTSNGMPYFTFEDQSERRIGVLYEYIDGMEIDKTHHIYQIGKETGKLHSIMKQYNGNLCFHDKPFFIDRYIDILNEMHYPRVESFIELGDKLWNQVTGLPRGFCHGDYHTGNMILTRDGKYGLFDFDASAIGFSVYDIAVICDMTNYFSLSEQSFYETSHILECFIEGYKECNSISKEELHSIYDFIAIRHFEVQATIIDNLGHSCVNFNFIDEQLKWLMNWVRLCKG